MNSSSSTTRVSALAFIYENIRDLPVWFRKLTPGQVQDVAKLMTRWQSTENDSFLPVKEILPMEEIEQREVLRAVMASQGNVVKAAKALKVGKTTMYRKLRKWGYTVRNRLLLSQASALQNPATLTAIHLHKPIVPSRHESVERPIDGFPGVLR